jgi:hypothetical protein
VEVSERKKMKRKRTKELRKAGGGPFKLLSRQPREHTGMIQSWQPMRRLENQMAVPEPSQHLQNLPELRKCGFVNKCRYTNLVRILIKCVYCSYNHRQTRETMADTLSSSHSHLSIRIQLGSLFAISKGSKLGLLL